MRRHGRAADGQGLVEFALIFPILALLVFGLVDFGRAIFIYSAVQDAAREGARYAIVHGSLAESLDKECASGPGASCDPTGNNVATQSKKYSFGLDPSQLTAAACWGFGCTVSADCSTASNALNASDTPLTPVTVDACYRFSTISGAFLPIGPLTLRAQATLTVNH